MRFILYAFLFVLPAILALPSLNGMSSQSTSLFSRFTSFLGASETRPIASPLIQYDDGAENSIPLPRGAAIESQAAKRYKTSSSYPKCRKGGKRNGYAHYPGWKILGDDLSGALPVVPRSNCIKVCDGYGDACSGTYFNEISNKCFLKGNKVQKWEFVETDEEGDAVDLIGGCAAWSEVVPTEMDEICCRD
ncbi:hypothetical protein IAU59_001856 [Kwoniella sp. CBS 9459]